MEEAGLAGAAGLVSSSDAEGALGSACRGRTMPCQGREPALQRLEEELGDFVWVLPLAVRAGLRLGLEASPGGRCEAFTYGLERAGLDTARESERFDALF